MKKAGKYLLLMLAALLPLLFLAGCSNPEQGSGTNITLKLGVLSLEDILPMVVADEKGYFAAEGLQVELIPFQSAVESQSAIQSGQIDGMMTDMIVAALLKDSGTDLRVTSVTLEATGDRRRFAIVVSPQSDITTLAGLKGKELAISFNSIIEYTTDVLLKHHGIDPEEVVKTAIPKIPVRLEMLVNNNIEAANIPDPLIAFAESNGCRTIVDDRGLSVSQAVLVMTEKTLVEKKEALQGFYRAYAKAVQEINSNPQDYKDTMVAHISIPEPIVDAYRVPLFPEPKLPSEEEVNGVLSWLREKGAIGEHITYENFVAKDLY
ncbi:MAG TPA: ABC transporter substrate-binding protein [Clostridia bacterium]|nr:ABC transporter substrate-binding protein [Clostridia bacterium]